MTEAEEGNEDQFVSPGDSAATLNSQHGMDPNEDSEMLPAADPGRQAATPKLPHQAYDMFKR